MEGDVEVRDWLLAKAFPSLTLPMGANPCSGENWKNNNFNMSVEFKPDSGAWPTNRQEAINGVMVDTWKHSDYKDVAYTYVFKFYDKIALPSHNLLKTPFV